MKRFVLVVLIATLGSLQAFSVAAEQGSPPQAEVLETVINSIPDVIFFKDLQGIYRGGNTAWAALLGRPLADLIGKSDFELFPKEVAASFVSHDRQMMESGKARSNKEWLTYPDGAKVHVETLKTPWVDRDGKILGLLGICHKLDAP